MSTSTERLLGVVWGSQRGYVFLPYKDAMAPGYPKRGWHETAGISYSGVVPDLSNLPQQADLYFCPLVFSQSQRKKEYALPTNILWSDLDPIHPESCRLRPSIAWESSPGRYQALWFLDEVVDPEIAADLSRRIAYGDDGDKGGWDLTQVLRIPGTANFKYPSKPPGRLLWAKRTRYPLSRVEATYPKSLIPSPSSPASSASVSLTTVSEFQVQSAIQSLPIGLQKRLQSSVPPEADRSTEIQRLSKSILKSGVSPDVAFHILQRSSWNKYAGRSDEQQRLLREVSLAQDAVSAHLSRVAAASSGTATDVIEAGSIGQEMRVHTWGSFLKIPTKLTWLVEESWVDRTVGFISGRSKSYKTWVALDLGLSVLSGKPFLNRFPVLRTGRVLLIQEEDPTAILQRRIELISLAKGMSPTAKHLGGTQFELHYPEYPLHVINLQGFSLTNKQMVANLRREIAEFQPDLIILDPLIVMMGGVKENVATDVAEVLQEVKMWREDFNCNIVIVHHWNKSKTEDGDRGGAHMYGSFAFHAWLESAWHIEPVVNLETTKIDTVIAEREFKAAPGERALRLHFDIDDVNDFRYAVEHEQGSVGAIAQKIMDLLGENGGWMTTGELVTLSGFNRTTVSVETGKLTRLGKIEAKKGGGRGVQSGYKLKTE